MRGLRVRVWASGVIPTVAAVPASRFPRAGVPHKGTTMLKPALAGAALAALLAASSSTADLTGQTVCGVPPTETVPFYVAEQVRKVVGMRPRPMPYDL